MKSIIDKEPEYRALKYKVGAFTLDQLVTTLSEDELLTVDAIGSRLRPARHVSVWQSGGVQPYIYLGGQRIILANFYSVPLWELAFRLADMATVYFWKYRIRGGGAQVNTALLNLSLNRVQDDLRHEEKLLDVLKQYEQLLLKHGIIDSDPGARREKDRRNIGKWEQFRDEMVTRDEATRDRVAAIEKRLEALEAPRTSVVVSSPSSLRAPAPQPDVVWCGTGLNNPTNKI